MKKKLDNFLICACHPCAEVILIFSISFQFYQMSPKDQARRRNIKTEIFTYLVDVGLTLDKTKQRAPLTAKDAFSQ